MKQFIEDIRMRGLTLLVVLISAVSAYAYQFILEGTIGGKYPIVVEVDRLSNGAIKGRYPYLKTLDKYGRDNKESWFYIQPVGNSNTQYKVQDYKKTYSEHWDIKMTRENGVNLLNGIITGTNGQTISISASSGKGTGNVKSQSLMSLQTMMDVSKKRRSDAIAYFKGKGLKPHDCGTDYHGQTIYYFETPEGIISIHNEGNPHLGSGAMEFVTQSKSVYQSWIRDLKASNYYPYDENRWGGDTGHFFNFGLYDFTDMSEDEDDYAGCYVLCVLGFPLVYDDYLKCYDEFEYQY